MNKRKRLPVPMKVDPAFHDMWKRIKIERIKTDKDDIPGISTQRFTLALSRLQSVEDILKKAEIRDTGGLL